LTRQSTGGRLGEDSPSSDLTATHSKGESFPYLLLTQGNGGHALK
jgi:hypothetical protein